MVVIHVNKADAVNMKVANKDQLDKIDKNHISQNKQPSDSLTKTK